MPARRSRTERWRDSLDSIVDRNGPIEISIDGPSDAQDLVWRVRLLSVDDEQLVIEQPMTLHRQVPIEEGTELIGAISIGQNRWMFHTRVLGHLKTEGRFGMQSSLRLGMPTTVERCQRRNFYRTSTASLSLPPIKCWTLKDPSSAVAMEIATRAAIIDALNGGPIVDPIDVAMPEVGTGIEASLLNIGGGGAGLLVPARDAQALNEPGSFWMRLDLSPTIPIPLSLTAKLAHTRVDSSHDVHVGLAFDFSRNRQYEAFVGEQICRYIARIQHPKSTNRNAA